MNKIQFLGELERLLELNPRTINGDEKLAEIDSWDSLAVLGFIALVDQKFNIVIAPEKINQAVTIDDLLLLLGKHIMS